MSAPEQPEPNDDEARDTGTTYGGPGGGLPPYKGVTPAPKRDERD